MLSELYWIDAPTPLNLAIMARPRAGDWLEDEISHWKRSGVSIVVSLLEREEIDDLGLGMEAVLCEENNIEYLSFPIPDRGVPNDVEAVMQFAAQISKTSGKVAIHCRAGIGRSSLMAAAILISSGVEPCAALSSIQPARGTRIPDTDAQREWVLKLEQR